VLDKQYIEEKIKKPEKSIEFIQCWMKGNIEHGTLRSTLDTWLVTDIIATMYEEKEIMTYIVVSGDADYLPAILHLRTNGKKVIVIFDEQSTSHILTQDVQDKILVDKSYKFVGIREWIRSQHNRPWTAP